jgi:hypothetical protein
MNSEPTQINSTIHTFHLEHKLISESPRVVSYRFSDEPEIQYASKEQALAARNLLGPYSDGTMFKDL